MEQVFLNLESPLDTEINFRYNNFPDGQLSITIEDNSVNRLYKSVEVVIVKSINNFLDLELIASAVSCLKSHTKNYSLYTPYIVGARSDRKFEIGGDFYFNDVILPYLKLMNFKRIVTFDLHCQIDWIESLSLYEFTNKYINYHGPLVFPDESAKIRNENFIFDEDNYVTFNKVRINGEVHQTVSDEFILEEILNDDEIMIMDDLFDGGASYVGLCESIVEEYDYSGKITIFVTHMIGSKIESLEKLQDLEVDVITSNSYLNRSGGNNAYDFDNIKVINVFDKDFIIKVW